MTSADVWYDILPIGGESFYKSNSNTWKITKGRCKHRCKDFPENRGERMSKYPGLAVLQKKCKECGYWCYIEELGLKCPCCNLKFGKGEGRKNRSMVIISTNDQ